ncbi:MAG: head decoration protein [Synergistaceae bacterium]|jgi:hypothetical protein|nr:head decoration protein [Synergistaceae bacterium]
MSRELLGTLGQSEQDNLIAGPRFPVANKGVTLLEGQGLLKRGTVLGIVTAHGQAVPVDSTAGDGSNSPDCVLAEDVYTGTEPGEPGVSAVAYSAGYFIRGSLIFGGADTYATHELEMRKLNIHLSSSIDKDGGIH